MSRRFIIFAAALIATSIALGSTALTANAYPVNGTPPTATLPFIPSINNFNFGNLTAPFENFIQSIDNIGTQGEINVPPVNVPSMPQNGIVTNWLQSAFQQFDAWLYGIAGFHISGLFVAILNILSWILGIAKNIVDWLLGVIHNS